MNQIILDGELKSKLNGLNEELKLCDESGEPMGRFLPEPIYRKMVYAVAEAQCPSLSDQEIDQRRQQKGRTLQEIWEPKGQT